MTRKNKKQTLIRDIENAADSDEVVISETGEIVLANSRKGKRIKCHPPKHTFYSSRSHNNRAVNAAAPSAGARHDGQSTDGERADNR
jgi:hypothetical protein